MACPKRHHIILFMLALLPAACGGATPPPTDARTGAPSLWIIPPELNGTRWNLITLNGQPLIAGTRISLTLQTGHTSGFAGCNTYSESFTTGPTPLPPGSFEITVMACYGTTGLIEQEQAYMAALEHAARRAQTADRLTFFDAAGTPTLVFEPQAR